MQISLLAAASENNVIGKNNQLVWNLPNDMRYFKNITWGMPVIMGRKTFDSFRGDPLPGRFNIVITRNRDWQPANPLLQVAWHAIAADDPRAPALNLLQTILTGGDASRLHRHLVEDRKLAIEVGSGWSEGFDPNTYSVFATLAAGASTVELEQALNAELASLATTGITLAELARAQHQVAASFWRGVSTMDGKARLLGEYAVLHGDYRKLFAAPEAYQRVTAEEVRAVARAVFKPQQRTVGVLLPQAPPAGH